MSGSAVWTATRRGGVVLVVWLVAAAAVLLVPASLMLSWPAFAGAGHDMWMNVGLALGCPVAGAMILCRVGNLVGWLLLLSGGSAAVTLMSLSYAQHALIDSPGSLPGGAYAVWITSMVWPLGVLPIVTLLPLLFPDGHLLSRAWVPVAACAIAAIALNIMDGATLPEIEMDDRTQVPNPVGGIAVLAIRGVVRDLVFVCLIVGFTGAVAGVVVRWRRSTGLVRQQLKWFVASVVSAVAVSLAVSTVLAGIVGVVSAAMVMLLIPTAVAVAVLRYRLYEIDIFLNRALVYGLVTGILLGVYVAVVALVSAAMNQRPVGLAGPLIATGLVAIAFSPVRSFVQRRINRLLYGDREDPTAALNRLGDRLAHLGPADALTELLATSIAEALRVPYVAISAGAEPGAAETASVGRRSGQPRTLTLTDRGTTVGVLEVGHRSGHERFTREDERLLDVLARQAALLLHADQLQHALQSSQGRLLDAVEEERRRLRHDLHDELGPTLAGIALGAETIANLLEGKQLPTRVADRLDLVRTQAQTAADDVRRLVYGLRPPALDELGLVGALSAYADQLAGPTGLAVRVDVAGNADDLPAAVETAAFRIATEALANALRHGAARTATVRIQRGDDLVLEVCDDGRGLEHDWRPGVGITSMRERTTRLGGSLRINQRPAGGTRVSAHLPVSTR